MSKSSSFRSLVRHCHTVFGISLKGVKEFTIYLKDLPKQTLDSYHLRMLHRDCVYSKLATPVLDSNQELIGVRFKAELHNCIRDDFDDYLRDAA